MKKIFITFAILLFSISTVNAGTVYGYLPCGTFLNDCEQSKLNIDCQTQTYFALGYISAYAAQDDVTFSNGIFNSEWTNGFMTINQILSDNFDNIWENISSEILSEIDSKTCMYPNGLCGDSDILPSIKGNPPELIKWYLAKYFKREELIQVKDR